MSNAPITPPPPIAVVYGGTLSYSPTSSPPPSSSSSALIVILIIASAIFISALIYFLLRFLSKRFRHPRRTFSAGVVPRNHASSENQNAGQLKCHVASDHDFFDSLPVFTFGSLAAGGGDCAVCLSKFERHDQLRLLPLCCHAFHAACIDAWLVSNRTCPLCRSTVLPSNSAALDKILSSGNNNNNSTNSRDGNSGSFRIQIGSISRRGATAETTAQPPRTRSYSVGSFDYNVLDYEVSLDHSATAIDKELSLEIPAPEVPATEVSGRRNWLREYVDRLTSVSSSHTMTFRNSGRSFTGSIRRSDAVVVPEDLEANRAYGEEISELFRWLTGV